MMAWPRTALMALGLFSGCVSVPEAPECSVPTARGVFQPGAITVAAVGDVLMHILLQEEAAQSDLGFAPQFARIAPYLQMADVAVANMEGPAAENTLPGGRIAATAPASRWDGEVYSGYPTFNYHPSLVSALAGAGVDVIQTANNHAMDRAATGVDRTIAAIGAAGLVHTGTHRQDAPDAPWFAVTEVAGRRLAWLACTFDTNGISDPGGQVLRCYDQRNAVLETIRALTARADIDAVFLLPHWGVEYSASPEPRQRTLAHQALDAGAVAVIGSHPHVLQPIERYRTADGRQTFVAYSLGNFIASQWEPEQRTGAILYMDLLPDAQGRLQAQPPRYLPTRVTRYTTGIVVQPATLAVNGQESIRLATRVLGAGGLLQPGDLVSPGSAPACTPEG